MDIYSLNVVFITLGFLIDNFLSKVLELIPVNVLYMITRRCTVNPKIKGLPKRNQL